MCLYRPFVDGAGVSLGKGNSTWARELPYEARVNFFRPNVSVLTIVRVNTNMCGHGTLVNDSHGVHHKLVALIWVKYIAASSVVSCLPAQAIDITQTSAYENVPLTNNSNVSAKKKRTKICCTCFLPVHAKCMSVRLSLSS